MPINEVSIDKMPDSRATLSLIRGDSRTQIVRFVIDRYEGGKDLAGLSWNVKAVNAKGESDVYSLGKADESWEKIKVDWLVHGVATAAAGETKFALEGVAEEGGPVVWRNGTRVMKVYEDLDAEPSVDGEQLTALQQLIVYVGGELPGVLEAGRAADKAAAGADAARERVEAHEDARDLAERERAEAESQRAVAEAERATAEAGRADAEAGRVDAEKARERAWGEIKSSVATATEDANAAAAAANSATASANEAAGKADAAAASAASAANSASEAAGAANSAAQTANEAAGRADDAVESADAAMAAANDAAATANGAASDANEAAAAANAAAGAASTAAERASAAESEANDAAGAASAAASSATDAAQTANNAAADAETAKVEAEVAANAANEAAGNANEAAGGATAAAELANAATGRADAAAQAANAAAESVADHLDGQYAALIDDTNTTALFKRWWAATEGEGTRYERLCRWFSRIMPCDATFTVRFYDEAVSGDPSGTAMDDLAALGAAPVATDTITPEGDWSVEHRMTWYVRANGLQREDGGLDVLAIEGEDGFDPTGEIAPVVTISCALYRRMWEADGYWYKSWKNSPAEGYAIMPEGVRPDGSIRPFVWHATFPGALTSDGRLTSGAGRKINNFAAAQNAIANARKMGAFEGLLTDCDSIWALDQFQMRHINKENGGIMEGCCRFNVQYAVALAETGVKRVLLTTSQAGNLHVGCAVAVGDPADKTNYDRGQSYMRNIVADALVTSIDSVEIDGTAYAAVTLDVPDAFDTTATTWISTMPWHSGTTEAVPGHHDGSPGSNTDGHYPFRLAGVEFMVGAYDVGIDPLYITTIPESGKVNYRIYSCPDSTKQAGSETNYTNTGLEFEYQATGWQYVREFHDDGAVLMPSAVGSASETTHYKSAFYPSADAGRFCPWRRGSLINGGTAGLAGANGYLGPGHAYWSGCPRLGGSGARRAAG